MFRILAIEDNPSDATILKFLLNKFGYETEIVANPFEALERLNVISFHLILLDWYLPKMSGLEFLKRIKKNPLKKDIPVVMMSGRNEAKDIKLAVKEGVSHYLIKPIDPEILKTKLQEFFSKNSDWNLTYLPSDFPGKSGAVTNSIELMAISEVQLVFKANCSLQLNEIYSIKVETLNELGIEEVVVKISQREDKEQYHEYICSPLGLKEEDLKKIRILCRMFASNSVSKNDIKNGA